MGKFKIAIVGVGNIAQSHIKGYLSNPDVELYALCDINETLLKQNGEKHGITRLYTDEATMLAELPEIDGVSICTWNSAHAPCAIMALKAGKHVLCEKPMATTVEDALAMKAAAEESGKLLMIGFVRRFGNDCMIVNDLINNGVLGDLYYTKAVNVRRNGNPEGWFGEKARSGGGPLIDIGVHSIDLVRYLIGKPQPVSVYGVTYNKLGARTEVKTPKSYVSKSKTDHDICDCEDIATALIRFDNGVTLSVEVSFSLNTVEEPNAIQIFGTDAGVKLASDVTLCGTTNGYLSTTNLLGKNGFDFEGSFARETKNFVDSARGLAECRSTADDGIALMKILTAVYESADSGHEVVIK